MVRGDRDWAVERERDWVGETEIGYERERDTVRREMAGN